mmetsp:Transcript_55418/g.49900  ORF Transcript_55418/g.49900 Transcript_55418/m.49900 type:complete len:429 (-) Transcript_55418:35-1321(-)
MMVSSGTIWMDRLSFMTAIINGLILLCLFITQLCNRMKNEKVALNIKIFNIFAVLTIFCGVTFCIQKIFASFGIFSDSDYHCELHVELGALFWLSMKHAMYICFILRLHIAFKDSLFEFSNKLFIFLYLIMIISYTSQLLAYIIFGDGKLHIDYDKDNQIPYCISDCPMWIRLYNAFCDFIIMILLCVLFIRRLYKSFILSQQHNQNSSFVVCEIAKIAQYITLTIVGVITTFIALILFGITSWFVWISIDIMINAWCILLMFKTNQKLFNKICCIFHKCVGYSFLKILECNQDITDHRNEKIDPQNTSRDFKKYSLENKDIAILTRFSICSIYDIECEHNVNTHSYPISNTEADIDGDISQTKTKEVMLRDIGLNLPHPELIAVPSRSDTMPMPIHTTGPSKMATISSRPSSDYSVNMDQIKMQITK